MSEPEGYRIHPGLKLVDIFTACTHTGVKNMLLRQFEKPASCLHVVVATVAFRKRLDLPNVQRVIH